MNNESLESALRNRVKQVRIVAEELTSQQQEKIDRADEIIGPEYSGLEDQRRFNTLAQASELLNEIAGDLGIIWLQKILWEN